MQMGMAIPVNRRKPERMEFFKLSGDFHRQIRLQRTLKSVPQAGTRRTSRKMAFAISQFGDARGAPAAQRKMQPDHEPRIPPSDPQRLIHASLVHHQARLREKSCLKKPFHRLVHSGIQPEIVSCHDQPLLALPIYETRFTLSFVHESYNIRKLAA